MPFSLISNQFHQFRDYIKKEYLQDKDISLLVQGFTSSLIIRAVGVGLKMLIAIFIARILGSSGYGIFTYSISWMAFLAVISMFGIEYVITRYLPAYLEQKLWSNLKGLLHFAIIFGLSTSFCITFISLIFVAFFANIDSNLKNTLIVTLLLIPIVTWVQTQQHIFRSLQHPGIGQIPEHIIYPIAFFISVLITLSLTKANPTAFHIALANIVGWALTIILGLRLLIKKIPPEIYQNKATYQISQWTGMIPSLAFVAIAYQIFSRSPILILGTMVNASEVGIYMASSKGAEFIDFVYGAMTIAGAALFSTINVKGDKVALQKFTSRINTLIFFLTLPVYLLLMLFTSQFLSLFGPDFKSGINVMRLLLTTYFLGSLTGFIEFMLPTTGHQRDLAIAICIMAPINAGLSFILIHFFGLIGAAFATSISVISFRISLVIILYKRTKIISLPFLNLGQR